MSGYFVLLQESRLNSREIAAGPPPRPTALRTANISGESRRGGALLPLPVAAAGRQHEGPGRRRRRPQGGAAVAAHRTDGAPHPTTTHGDHPPAGNQPRHTKVIFGALNEGEIMHLFIP